MAYAELCPKGDKFLESLIWFQPIMNPLDELLEYSNYGKILFLLLLFVNFGQRSCLDFGEQGVAYLLSARKFAVSPRCFP